MAPVDSPTKWKRIRWRGRDDADANDGGAASDGDDGGAASAADDGGASPPYSLCT